MIRVFTFDSEARTLEAIKEFNLERYHKDTRHYNNCIGVVLDTTNLWAIEACQNWLESPKYDVDYYNVTSST